MLLISEERAGNFVIVFKAKQRHIWADLLVFSKKLHNEGACYSVNVGLHMFLSVVLINKFFTAFD